VIGCFEAGATTNSIGETSMDAMTMASLNLSHSSNIDKLARPDHDTSSTIAIAGESLYFDRLKLVKI